MVSVRIESTKERGEGIRYELESDWFGDDKEGLAPRWLEAIRRLKAGFKGSEPSIYSDFICFIPKGPVTEEKIREVLNTPIKISVTCKVTEKKVEVKSSVPTQFDATQIKNLRQVENAWMDNTNIVRVTVHSREDPKKVSKIIKSLLSDG